MHTTICGNCNTEWDQDCEQGVSIEWYGQCIPCKFKSEPPSQLVADQLLQIASEAKKRALPFRNVPPITQVDDWIKYNLAERTYKETLLHVLESELAGTEVSMNQYLSHLNEYDIDVTEEYILLVFGKANKKEVLDVFYANEAKKP